MQKWKSEQSRLLPMKQSKSEHVFNGGKKKKGSSRTNICKVVEVVE